MVFFIRSRNNRGIARRRYVCRRRDANLQQGQIDFTIDQSIYDMFSERSGRLDFRGCVRVDEEGRPPSILLGVGVLVLSFAVLGAAAYILGNLDAD